MPCKIIVIPNSIDISSWQQYAITKPHKGINIIYAGRMVWSKCIGVLIRAFHKVSNKYPHTSLILVGDGSELGIYRSLVKELNIESKVIFTGYVKQEDYNITTQLQISLCTPPYLKHLAFRFLKQWHTMYPRWCLIMGRLKK